MPPPLQPALYAVMMMKAGAAIVDTEVISSVYLLKCSFKLLV